MTALSFRKLTLTDFRNYASASLALDGRSLVLTGANGAGKTNVLEALSMLSPGRGLRSARMEELSRDTGDGVPRHWAVAATLAVDASTGCDEIRLGTGLDPASATPKRIVRVDGRTASGPGVFATHFSLVWLTPQLDRLFAEGASQRRRFLDRLVLGVDPGHASQSAAYEKAARERLRLLEQGKSGGRVDGAWLAALEEQMAAPAVALAAARLSFVERLAQVIEARADESAFPSAGLSLKGALEDALSGGKSALDVEDWFLETLKSNRARDAAAGRTTLGPNRSDLEVTFGLGGRAAKDCSTGEQKALLIGMVLANARLKRGLAAGAPPILLLDEVAAHLDPGRRSALFDELEAIGAQAFLTGTERALFEGFEGRAQYASVDNGCVTLEP